MAWQLQQGVGTLAYPFYVGFSYEEKPTLTSRSATAYELDTRDRYVWRENQWYLFEVPPALDADAIDDQARINWLILNELKDIRLLLSAALTRRA